MKLPHQKWPWCLGVWLWSDPSTAHHAGIVKFSEQSRPVHRYWAKHGLRATVKDTGVAERQAAAERLGLPVVTIPRSGSPAADSTATAPVEGHRLRRRPVSAPLSVVNSSQKNKQTKKTPKQTNKRKQYAAEISAQINKSFPRLLSRLMTDMHKYTFIVCEHLNVQIDLFLAYGAKR
uniref:Histone H2A/H2B/H3 domain-containing protein n=1 Tax=Electrophorus electricus TaxID=8005 RepID=A0AAY5F508_ELEEL